jgi:hypothetical protein
MAHHAIAVVGDHTARWCQAQNEGGEEDNRYCRNSLSASLGHRYLDIAQPTATIAVVPIETGSIDPGSGRLDDVVSVLDPGTGPGGTTHAHVLDIILLKVPLQEG